jgi:hypothetical protein
MNTSIKWCVMVLALDELPHTKYAKSILEDYFKSNNIEYKFIETIPQDIELKDAHPSWYKLLAHKILPDYDFILCWDLDLLPKNRYVTFVNEINFNKLNMVWDTSAKIGPAYRFTPNFKYNGGLIGIPKYMSVFTEFVFNHYAPNLFNWPNNEVYYLNEMITHNNNLFDVHELSDDLNYIYGHAKFNDARLQHYTHNLLDNVHTHYDKYFNLGTKFVLQQWQ